MSLTPETVKAGLISASAEACAEINTFTKEVLHTRGGRVGSGMGSLLEALWGYYINRVIQKESSPIADCELAWMPGHQYNDFACIFKDAKWDPNNGDGEILRIEAKSMVACADESKAHFDQLQKNISPHDLLVVLVWDWKPVDAIRVCPQVIDSFMAPALGVAELRDALHIGRGGSFVDKNTCPDGCNPDECPHDGEPLNAEGKRERLSGPEACRVSAKTSYGANYGGMVRMLKTDSAEARVIFREMRRNNEIANRYVSFIHKNFPAEEENQYTAKEWRELALRIGIEKPPSRKTDVIRLVREASPDYGLRF